MDTTSTPPVIPPPLPSVIENRPSPLSVSMLAGGAVLLFFLNLLLPMVTLEMKHRHMAGAALAGYVTGNSLMPFAGIMCICACWKANRRGYRMLYCAFWVLLALLVPKLNDLATAVKHLNH